MHWSELPIEILSTTYTYLLVTCVVLERSANNHSVMRAFDSLRPFLWRLVHRGAMAFVIALLHCSHWPLPRAHLAANHSVPVVLTRIWKTPIYLQLHCTIHHLQPTTQRSPFLYFFLSNYCVRACSGRLLARIL